MAIKGEFFLFFFFFFFLGLIRNHVSADCIPPQGCTTALAYYTLPNETLYDTAIRFGTTYPAIQKYSNISDPNHLDVGQPLFIPFPCDHCLGTSLGHTFPYTVAQDDQLSTIAHLKFGNLSQIDWIIAANPSQDLSSLFPGMILEIPVNCSCGNPHVSLNYGLFATYVAQPNDNLARISMKFNVSSSLLQGYNGGIWSNLEADESIIFVPATDGSGKYPPFNISENNAGKGRSTKGVLYGTLFGGIILFSLIGLGLFYFIPYMRRKRGDHIHDGIQAEHLMSGMPAVEKEYAKGTEISDLTNSVMDKSVEYSYLELVEATDNFSIGKEIGRGGFGCVYYGEIRGQRLAIKKMDLKAERQFVSELNILTRVHHANLVRLVGYCASDSLFLALEFVDNGTLSQHLRGAGREGNPPLTWASRVQIALEAARGLEYIHYHTTPTYIHRDVKSSNILLDKELHAKVSDFGLTKFASSDGASAQQTKAMGTFGYLAPECLMVGDISQKGDVYSFGVVLFEIISARDAIVYDMEGNRKALVNLFEDVLNDPDGKQKIQSLIDPALGDQYDLDSIWKMANLARACTKAEPGLRPNMQAIVIALMTLASDNCYSSHDVDL